MATDEEVEEFFTIVGECTRQQHISRERVRRRGLGGDWRAVEAAGMAGVEEDEGRPEKKGNHKDDDQECSRKSRNAEQKVAGSYQIDLNKHPF